MSDAQTDDQTAAPGRHPRRLSDKVLTAFHYACDRGEFEAAEQLLQVLEMTSVKRPLPAADNKRRNLESLVAAHERLWALRHTTVEGC